MKRFADSIARQKGIRPPSGYTKSGSICRAFLDRHAPKKAGGEPPGEPGSKPASPAQVLFAEKIARERGSGSEQSVKTLSIKRSLTRVLSGRLRYTPAAASPITRPRAS
jgi:DNA topoisomerase-3